MTDALIVGLNGTLRDVSGLGLADDFTGFHRDALGAPAVEWVVELAREAKRAGRHVIVMTGTPAAWADETLLWLQDAGVRHDRLYMRPDDDIRAPDAVIKRVHWERVQRAGYVIRAAVDDQEKVCKLWRNLGVPNVMLVPPQVR